MNSLKNQLQINTSTLDRIIQRIHEAERKANREIGSSLLVGASKAQDSQTIHAFHMAGLHDFGENYLNEAIEKIHALSNLNIYWHYIGSIQSNKTSAIAQHFDWVHTVDRLKIAQRLSRHLNEHLEVSGESKTLNILLQVNLDDEQSKKGVTLDRLEDLTQAISALPHLQLRGLMSIPKPRKHYDDQLQSHLQLASLKDQLNQNLNLSLDTLSMGMSNDLEAAISAGSTMVRIGTDLFGKRK